MAATAHGVQVRTGEHGRSRATASPNAEDVADLIDALKPSQLLKVASGGAMMCRLRVQDETIWDLLSDHARSDSLSGEKSAERLHARILMAGKHAEAVE